MVQVDVRKKVLWGRWAERALAGARNRHGWEMLRTNGGDDERAVAVVANSEQQSGLDSGGLVSCGSVEYWCTRGHNASQRVAAP